MDLLLLLNPNSSHGSGSGTLEEISLVFALCTTSGYQIVSHHLQWLPFMSSNYAIQLAFTIVQLPNQIE